jgi:hypothetical protein
MSEQRELVEIKDAMVEPVFGMSRTDSKYKVVLRTIEQVDIEFVLTPEAITNLIIGMTLAGQAVSFKFPPDGSRA